MIVMNIGSQETFRDPRKLEGLLKQVIQDLALYDLELAEQYDTQRLNIPFDFVIEKRPSQQS